MAYSELSGLQTVTTGSAGAPSGANRPYDGGLFYPIANHTTIQIDIAPVAISDPSVAGRTGKYQAYIAPNGEALALAGESPIVTQTQDGKWAQSQIIIVNQLPNTTYTVALKFDDSA